MDKNRLKISLLFLVFCTTSNIFSQSQATEVATDVRPALTKIKTIYLVQHTHTDIGYTKPQTEILAEHIRYIDYAIEYCELTDHYPDDAKFRWTCEASWAVREYLQNRPKEQIDKFLKYVKAGRIEVTGMFFNMADLIDENSLKTFLEPIRVFKQSGITVSTAMQNDVHGIPWCLADYMPDLGVKYFTMGENADHSLLLFDKPTVYKWESPSGKQAYAFRSDHYHRANHWGIDKGSFKEMAPAVFSYLENLESAGYPFDAISIQYSGYFTDNSPPSIRECDLIRDWNNTYASPKLRSAVFHEFMDYIVEKYDQQLPVYRGAYPDWWSDGFGSAARETAASRKTHADMITVQGLLSMAVLKEKTLPPHIPDKIRHIHENLLFYDEHTYGAAESVTDPNSENSQIQWAEKSSYVWEALKNTQILYETSTGLLQNDIHRGEYPTVTFYNTLNWVRSGVVELYIDFEIIPNNRSFRIVDESGKELKTQKLRTIREGAYFGVYAEDIPPMGYKTCHILVEKDNQPESPLTSLHYNTIENEYYTITFDTQTGSIKSLFDKQVQLEMVDAASSWPLGAFVYETLGDRTPLIRSTLPEYDRKGLTDVQIWAGANGSIYQSIHISGKSGCCLDDFGVKIEIRLFHNEKRIELHYAVKKSPVIDPDGIYIAFPFKLDQAKLFFDVQGGTVSSGENQLEGSASDWNVVQHFVAARNQTAQFVVGSNLIPLFQLGGIRTGLFQRKKTYEFPHVYSWVTNNYWHTNFRATQEGELRWSYYLTSDKDVSNTFASRFGWASRTPIYARVMPEGKPNNLPMAYSSFRFSNDNLLMTSATPSIDEGYILINVRELDGKSTALLLIDSSGKALTFSIVNAIEEPIQNGLKEAHFAPYENKFIKLKLSGNSPKPVEQQPFAFVDKVYPLLDSENSRWFFFSSACRPFGMVNLSPDNEIDGDWGSGYRYKIDTVKSFSHIHAWQISGLSVMPVNLSSADHAGVYHDFASKFSHETETVIPGYHSLMLDRYGIKVELTSTKRVGFHRYTFPEGTTPAVLFNLNKQIGPCLNRDGKLVQTGPRTVAGSFVNSPTRRKPKDLGIYFQVAFDRDIKAIEQDPASGNYLITFEMLHDQPLLMKASISYTSGDNAALNMSTELAHWDFEQVMNDSFDEWNRMLGRIEIEGGNEQQQRRFYTDLWHAIQGRRVISDVNGAYPDNTGDRFRIGQIPCDKSGKPLFNHYNFDGFWGAQWTLNTLWQLVYPEIAEEFIHSMMMMYRDGGLIPRGPAGGNYTFVMTGASTTPFIVAAVQKGIVKDGLEALYQACKKNHLPGGIMEKAGYEHHTSVGGGLKYYIDMGYVPYPLPEESDGFHQQGAGMTLEYAYQDWTLAQFAKHLGHTDDYAYFMKRSQNYKNLFDTETGWIRPKDINGQWYTPFDPYEYAKGFVESNSAQATWFVPHDLPGLAQLMGGPEAAKQKLEQQFIEARKLGFTSGKSHEQETHPEYRRIPINYGNQPSTQTAHVFAMLGYPHLSQYWTRKLVNAAFSGLDPSTGYNGDEDQGMMGSLSVLLKTGLFQMSGGTEKDAPYQIGSPVFDKITFHLNNRYYTGKTFVILANHNSDTHVYIQKARFNGEDWPSHQIPHSLLTAGGILELEMGDKPGLIEHSR